MAKLVQAPSLVQAAGQPPKQIEEFFGRVNTSSEAVSIARMISPEGWSEPGQTAEFDEYTVVLTGQLRLELSEAELIVPAGQAVLVTAGEWVRYSTPASGGATYLSVCLPAFSPQTVRRDGD